ncbi:Protein of unknown function [Pyronema omphalodes CBS 100304]|uniref:Uncharacterized protein n=1 Tax=Pyronema omphalodes (strain CBS 100304) TaxID=1076935 RepID=U4KZ77_PYROM|nr:Protein of unknown function [Pyronema omphalodes CBS 100304]
MLGKSALMPHLPYSIMVSRELSALLYFCLGLPSKEVPGSVKLCIVQLRTRSHPNTNTEPRSMVQHLFIASECRMRLRLSRGVSGVLRSEYSNTNPVFLWKGLHLRTILACSPASHEIFNST